MLQVTVEELPQKIGSLLIQIENGESFQITKSGLPIAEISPIKKPIPGWKRNIKRVELPPGVSILAMIEEERDIR